MAKEFLARILTIENSVTSEGSRDCIICQEKCGTLSPESGIMELEVRLPCSHTAGSACIASWLASNNTCPLCRYEFFPRQPRPYMEHEVMQSNEDEESDFEERQEGESDGQYLTRVAGISEPHDDAIGFAISYSQQLNLTLPAAILAINIAGCAESLFALDHHSRRSIAAASIYIASYNLDQRRSLADIAFLADARERYVHNIYKEIMSEFIDEDWAQIFGTLPLAEISETLPSLLMPPLEHEPTNSDGEQEERVEEHNDSGPSMLGCLEFVKKLCFDFYGDSDPDNLIGVMAQKVAERMDSLPLDWKTANPWILAAACTYMALHLVFQGKTIENVSTVSGVSSASIRSTYEVMFLVRELIVQEEWFEKLLWTRENVLYCLPEP